MGVRLGFQRCPALLPAHPHVPLCAHPLVAQAHARHWLQLPAPGRHWRGAAADGCAAASRERGAAATGGQGTGCVHEHGSSHSIARHDLHAPTRTHTLAVRTRPPARTHTVCVCHVPQVEKAGPGTPARVVLASGASVSARRGVVVAVEGPEAARLLGGELQARAGMRACACARVCCARWARKRVRACVCLGRGWQLPQPAVARAAPRPSMP